MPLTNMKIVINGKFLLANVEGMPRVGREITTAIDKLLVDPKYSKLEIVLAVPRGGSKQLSLKNISVVEVGKRQGLFWEQFEFPRYIGKLYSLNFTGTAPVMKREGCVVVHDAQFRSTTKSHGWKSYLLYNVITPFVAKKYKHIITVSNYAKDEIFRFNVVKRNDIHVIHNGIDHFIKRNDDDRIFSKLGIEKNEYALTNSYIHAHKNVKTVLDAFNLYKKDKKLVLFGSTPKSEYDAKGVSVPENAIFAGRVTDGELVALLRNARMFIFPSTTEGFGLPPLEAMSLGTPTICSNSGAMPEICADGALFVDQPYSPQEWATQIDRLWSNDDLRAELTSKGVAVSERYKWEESARRYLDVIMSA